MSGWRYIVWEVLRLPACTDLKVHKYEVVHPLEDPEIPFTRTLGEPKGQLADYGYTLPDDGRIHIREYRDHYTIHWDHVDPTLSPRHFWEHIKRDAPHWKPLIELGAIILAIIILKKLSNRNTSHT